MLELFIIWLVSFIFSFMVGRYLGKKEILDMLNFEIIKKKNQD